MNKHTEITDPLDLPVQWRPVSPSLITIRYQLAAIWLGLPLLVLAGLALWLSVGWLWLTAGAVLAFAVWVAWLIPRQVRAIGYAQQADDLLIRKGILVRTLTIVPYGRMQTIDVSSGPFARRAGIATVTLKTASSGVDAEIPGLAAAEAAALRDTLAALGESRMVGL